MIITANLILRLIGLVILMAGTAGTLTGIVALTADEPFVALVGMPITAVGLLLIGVGAIAARK